VEKKKVAFGGYGFLNLKEGCPLLSFWRQMKNKTVMDRILQRKKLQLSLFLQYQMSKKKNPKGQSNSQN
jgi:hypothetical protein